MTGSVTPGLVLGKWPGVIHSYDKNSRECLVHIPGITDGAENPLLAEIEYPVGDKSFAGQFCTDILILAGDHVWLEFLGGDPRFPIITGQRNPQIGNGTDWRRFHQQNMELLAVEQMNLKANNILIQAGTSITLNVGGSTIVITAGSITATAGTINLN